MLELTALSRPQKAAVNGQDDNKTSTSTETTSAPSLVVDGVTLQPQHPDEISSLEDIKRTAVLQAYKLCEGNVDQTSIRLGITRSTVYRLLEKYKNEGHSF